MLKGTPLSIRIGASNITKIRRDPQPPCFDGDMPTSDGKHREFLLICERTGCGAGHDHDELKGRG